MDKRTITVKETDVVVLRVDHMTGSDLATAQALHDETGAIVLILPMRVLDVHVMSNEEASIMYEALKLKLGHDEEADK